MGCAGKTLVDFGGRTLQAKRRQWKIRKLSTGRDEPEADDDILLLAVLFLLLRLRLFPFSPRYLLVRPFDNRAPAPILRLEILQ